MHVQEPQPIAAYYARFTETFHSHLRTDAFNNNYLNYPTPKLTKATAVVGVAMRQRQAHFLSLAPRESHPPAPKWGQ